MAPAALRVALG